tara:strand:+ start:417 stop:1841 length:1425 start_codon:yes stop_codon:yes gene_type:complete
MFRSIVQSAPLGVVIYDNYGKVIFSNAMADSILASNSMSIVGRNISELLSSPLPADKNPINSRFSDTDENLLSVIFEDGDERYFDVKLSHSAEKNKEPLNIITYIDVTRRVQALRKVEDQEQRWDLALQGSQIGVFESDLRTGTGFASQTWYELLGISKVKGLDSDAEWHARVHPDDLAFVVASDAQCIEGSTEKSETIFRMKVQDGSWRWMKSILRVTERDSTGKAVRLLGTTIDITDEKRVEELKNEFVATVSHELRTPLAAIYGALGLLTGSLSDTTSEKIKKLVGMAQRNTARLIQVVDELLDFQKLRTGHFSVKMERLDIVDLVRQVTIDNEPYAQKFSVSLTLEVPDFDVMVHADPLRIKQVLTNIISNAVKFSNSGGNVSIDVTCSEHDCKILVKDNGRGISDDFGKRIFEPFSQQADHLTRNKGGSGLGLAISKNLIELMFGSIGYESAVNVETTFWVSLPIAKEG